MSVPSLLLLLCCSLASALDAASWDPHAHPALLQREISAFTAPRRSMILAAEFAGRVEAVTVEAGEVIADGTVVIRLDATLAQLARDQAAAQAEALRQGLELARLAQALAQRERAFRERELTRVEGLAARGQAAEQELDRLGLERDLARLQEQQAQIRLAGATQELRVGELALALAEEHLARHHLAAPPGWTVVARLVEPGTVVQPQQPLLELADTRSLLVSCLLDENEIAALRALGPLSVRFPQQAGASVPARLHRVAVIFDPHSRKRLVELLIDGAVAPEASGGLELRFVIPLPDPDGGLRVPRPFVRWIGEQAFVEGDDGRRRSLTVLRSDERELIVASNALPEGLRLLLAEGE
jgi:multidrug efflux pump subunit AcrA (membrane-fusion protein)